MKNTSSYDVTTTLFDIKGKIRNLKLKIFYPNLIHFFAKGSF
jgi:hypothetical protein